MNHLVVTAAVTGTSAQGVRVDFSWGPEPNQAGYCIVTNGVITFGIIFTDGIGDRSYSTGEAMPRDIVQAVMKAVRQ